MAVNEDGYGSDHQSHNGIRPRSSGDGDSDSVDKLQERVHSVGAGLNTVSLSLPPTGTYETVSSANMEFAWCHGSSQKQFISARNEP